MNRYPHWLFVAALLARTGATHGQNLVPNGGFEEFTTNCAFGIGYNSLEDWGYLTCGVSPGLFHACNNSVGNGGGVPQNALGYQQAHGGDAFISTWTLRMNSQGGFPDGNPQKYANVDLTEPLVANQHYCLRLWMNMADSTCYETGAFHAYVWYGTPSICNNQDTAWDTNATVTWDISGVDTSAWTLLEGEFDANGGETSLTLGAFQFEEEIDSVFLADHSALLGGLLAIYFIDDVELWACQVGVGEGLEAPPMSLFPNPATDVVTITVPGPFDRGSLEVIALDGRTVASRAVVGPHVQLDVSDLPAGEYVVGWRTNARTLVSRLTVIR